MLVMKPARRLPLRSAIFHLLDNGKERSTLSKVVDIFLISLIALSIIAVILESVPALEVRYESWFYWIEVFSVAVFSVEYVLRVWTSVENPAISAALKARPFPRLRYVFTPYALIDLVAILPFYLVTFGLSGAVDMRFLRAVRLLRIFKLTRYSSAFDMLVACCVENRQSLGAAFFVLLTVMLLAASGMYYFEREMQPVAFGSIPAAMWWAFATLTTVGYGDVTPVTAGGKVFGALITVIGIGMVALPTGILASGYTQQLRLRAKQYEARAEEALDDGVLSEDEISDLEALRKDLGIGKHTASQILDSRMVKRAIQREVNTIKCPHCGSRRQKAPG